MPLPVDRFDLLLLFFLFAKITNDFFSGDRLKNYDFSLDIKQYINFTPIIIIITGSVQESYQFFLYPNGFIFSYRFSAGVVRFCQHSCLQWITFSARFCWFCVRVCYLENLCTHSLPPRICALNSIMKVNWTRQSRRMKRKVIACSRKKNSGWCRLE